MLPGFELSTPEGHLLGIWEEGTAPSTIEDVLIRLGIERARLGDLDVVAAKSMAECAAEINVKGGVAIAAHIDKDRGILTQPVQTHVNQLLANPNITAFEYVLPQTPAKVAAKLGATRYPALIQSSDAYDAALSRHSATGIGVRRSWIKAARPDLCGLRYALEDPNLRVTLSDPTASAPHPTIDFISISDGFLGGAALRFSPDLNCLLGGTGAGKSLVLEALRFALDQQVDQVLFPTIRDEVDRRLESALSEGADVAVEISTPTDVYRVTRTYRSIGSRPIVEQDIAGEWVQVDRVPSSLLTLAAFSQGEILEYARQPVGRVGLVDAKLDLTEIEARIADSEGQLKANGAYLIATRDRMQALAEEAAEAKTLKARERELSTLFDGDLVKAQGRWTSERSAITTLVGSLEAVSFDRPIAPAPAVAKMTPEHDTEFKRIQTAQEAFKAAIDSAETLVNASLTNLKTVVGEVERELNVEFQAFKKQLDETLEKSGSASLAKLRRELEAVQTNLSKAESAAQTLKDEAHPEYDRLSQERETLLAELKDARDDRRALRRALADELNKKTSGFVRIDVPNRGDTTEFRKALDVLKVGSRLREQVLDRIAENVRPYNLVRAIWSGDMSKAGPLPTGVTAADISRLLAAVAERDFWQKLLDVQLIETPDVLNVKFRKPEGRDYANIEDLSHGQKCTAILVILLADGENPVLIDQPEDALHAPWIEEYLVDRLRELRGTRQYVFATRGTAARIGDRLGHAA
ncbi:AAA domain-containing protein [Blastococcus tunisiensis]|uniref:AAA domain-containing protein n=1 Tax=Blastococcus tunisiensis TaxID=1798228 RepID=A0A1I2MX38_9ACTN|nr:AAA domain-containing protein [Blastococcus sp. DSM 46838]